MKKTLVSITICLISGMAFGQALNSSVKTNKTELKKLAEKWNKRFQETNRLFRQKASTQNLELIKEVEGSLIQLKGFTETGMPIYYTTDNVVAAQSISTNLVYPGGSLGLNLTGSSMTIGEWDGGGVLESHQEYGGRVTNMDNPSQTHYHAAHVAGTMVAAGVDPLAKGMAYEATLSHYDWSNDESEMANEAANGLILSNHSYSLLTGWSYNYRNDGLWAWFGDAAISETDDYRQGFYDAQAREWDLIAFNAPYYLILRAAGNARNDEPSSPGEEHWYRNPDNGYQWELSTTVRQGDGPYDCINGSGVSKNVLTVGAVEDVNGGYNGTSSVNMSTFSSWGPTDDGRIKPDVVANGVGVYSTFDDHPTAYNSISGTSMATPSVTGSLALVQEHYKNENNVYMKSATLKALTIHTSDEAGTTDGPDYQFGWGLVNTAKAVNVISNRDVTSLIEENTLQNGQTETIDVYSDGTTPLMVTICWTDPAGNVPSASVDNRTKVLVNDLNLKVSNGGQDVFPWKLDPANPSQGAIRGVNDVDNVEKVEILNPIEGTYTITINHASNLSGGSQDYALIVTGLQAQPSFCSGNTNFTANSGNFSDGSLDQNYQPNSNCTWFINPVGATSIDLSFSLFDLHVSDQVNVYRGSSNAGTLLNSYTGSSVPSTQNITGDEVFVEFISDASAESAGFSASYSAISPYCEPKGNTTDGDYIDNFYLGTISNVGTGSTTGSDYTFYSNMSTELTKGATYNVTTTSGTNTFAPNFVAAWIDYNRDGDFDDANEKLGEVELINLPNETSNISFTVPTGVDTGVTRVRVRLNYDDSPVMPCEEYSYGETEDYLVYIVESSNDYCIPDQSANGTNNGYFINSFRILGMNNMNTGGVGVSEYSLYNNDTIRVNRNMVVNMGAELGDVANASFAIWIDFDQNQVFDDEERVGSYFFPQANTFYGLQEFTIPETAELGVTRLRIRTFPNGENVDPCLNYSDQETEDYLINIEEADVYCIPFVRYNGLDNDININSVMLGDINNANTGLDGGKAYTYYESTNTELMVSSTQQLSVQVNSVYDPAQYIAAWIDFNNDGDFEDSNEKLGEISVAENNGTEVFSFNVPAGSNLGMTRMRIRNAHDANQLNSCDDFEAFGETEDYNVTIISNPCAGFPTKPSAINGSENVCKYDSVEYAVLNSNAFEMYEWTIPGGWSGISTTNTITVYDFDVTGEICVRGYSSDCGYTQQSSCFAINVVQEFGNGEMLITGDTVLCDHEQNIVRTYMLTHNLNNVDSYSWEIPVGAVVQSGGGTENITLDLSNVTRGEDFEICALVANDCYEQEVCMPVRFINCTGVDDLDLSNDVNVYPNPTNGLVHIQSNKAIDVSVYDLQGRVIATEVQRNVNGEFTIDLNGKDKGVYNFVIKHNKGVVNKRVVVQ